MKKQIKKVVIVGGGSAGWLTAGVLAGTFLSDKNKQFQVVLIESPDIKTIGVGEGTWPSMRSTLQTIGISESDLIRHCDVSFKQGTRFNGWASGQSQDYYYHPFSLPEGFADINLANHWQAHADDISFAEAVCTQAALCDRDLAPKQITTPEYAFNANYGYHLDAGKFATLLTTHCVDNLGVTHIQDEVIAVNNDENGYISAVKTKNNADIQGDLFIDCSGFSALLIAQHYGVGFNDVKHILFNDRACVTQVPYTDEQAPIKSYTASSAQQYGWVWDIGLQTRRGVGYVYNSDMIRDDQASDTLQRYVSNAGNTAVSNDKIDENQSLESRILTIKPGYRKEFWHKNCLAIGLSAGFVEPLEASALVLVEMSAKLLAEQFPDDYDTMSIIAKRFNHKFDYRWQQIVDFLKLHYVLSQRDDSDYWKENRQAASITDSLAESLSLWQSQVPWHQDAPYIDELFSSASFQFVLYGMNFKTRGGQRDYRQQEPLVRARELFQLNQTKKQKLVNAMPSNRDLINRIIKHGFQKI